MRYLAPTSSERIAGSDRKMMSEAIDLGSLPGGNGAEGRTMAREEQRWPLVGIKTFAALTVVVAMVGVLMLDSGQALGASPRVGTAGRQPWASLVVSPAAGALVLGRSVRVSVRLGSGVSSFRVLIGSHVVTGVFHR